MRLCAIAVVVGVAVPVALGAQERAGEMVEWRYVGAEQSHTKYAALDDINLMNVDQLEIVWEWEPGELPLEEFGTRPGSFQATPLMIDNVVYLSTMYTRVVALDADTGEELWAFDPEAYRTGPRGAGPGGFKHRGVAVWGSGDDMRIFLNSRDSLYALDAKTGELIRGFGDDGTVLLTDRFPNEVTRDEFDQTSPPVVFEDLVIVGSRVPDRVQHRFDTPGSVQAFDTHTGERRWVFYTVPQSNDAFGADTWENGSWRFTGHANVWGLMSLDEDRGLLYVPTSTPSSDYWGGRRLGANLFAESLLCLDARTGEREWHFQAVHHSLWDYDFTSPPNLMTLDVGGRTIDAVAEVSKQGFTYVFDRVTGEPVWPIEERPVDTETDVPGEVPYPTQRFRPDRRLLRNRASSLDDANDLTPEVHRLALKELRTYRLGPLFTPPSLRGTLQRRGSTAAATGAARRSTRRRTCCMSGRPRGPRRIRCARPTPTCRMWTSRIRTTARVERRLPSTAGGPVPPSWPVVVSARFRSSSHPTRGSSRSISTRATSRGACPSARAAHWCPAPAAAGCRAARPSRHPRGQRSDGDGGWTCLHWRRRSVSVCLRCRDGARGVACGDRVPDQWKPDDLSLALRGDSSS